MIIKEKKTRVKLLSFIILLLTVMWLLLAVGGQLNFFGNTRLKSDLLTPKKNKRLLKDEYRFYNDLKNKKIEIDEETRKEFLKLAKDREEKIKREENYSYVIQVGAFSRKKDATKSMEKVINIGYITRVFKIGSKYIVRVGPYKGKNKVINIEKLLKKHGFPTLIKRGK